MTQGPRRGDAGAAGLLVVTCATVVAMAAGLALSVVSDVLATAARARTAADAAALAAISTSPLVDRLPSGRPESAAAAAARLAAANGARSTRCDCDDPLAATVDVAVRPALPIVRAMAPWMSATATAELRPAEP